MNSVKDVSVYSIDKMHSARSERFSSIDRAFSEVKSQFEAQLDHFPARVLVYNPAATEGMRIPAGAVRVDDNGLSRELVADMARQAFPGFHVGSERVVGTHGGWYLTVTEPSDR